MIAMKDSAVHQNNWKINPDTTVQVVEPMGLKQKQLEKSKKSKRNWYGICIALSIISSLSLLIAIATLIAIPFRKVPYFGRSLTMEELNDPRMNPGPSDSQWLSGYELAYFSKHDGLLILNIELNEYKTIICNLTLNHIGALKFSISHDRRYVLLTHDIVEGRLFRKEAKYTIFDLQENLYFPFKLNPKNLDHPSYQHVRWLKQNPNHHFFDDQRTNTSTSSSELIVIDKNDIIYLKEPNSEPAFITTSGKRNQIYNGIPDLLYEEILRSSSTLWTNPEGDLLCFLSFNDSLVKKIPILKHTEKDSPQVINISYPTVKTVITQVQIWIVDMKNISNRYYLSLPTPLFEKEHYILGIGWIDNKHIWVSAVSRDQNTHLLASCGGIKWFCSTVFVNYVKDGISPIVQSVVWSESWVAFPWPMQSKYALWHNNIAIIGLSGSYHPTLKLDGCHVDKVLAYRSQFKKIYFLGSEILEGTEKQQLYSITLNSGRHECLTCTIECPRILAKLNSANTHAVVDCVGSYIPSSYLYDLDGINETIILNNQPKLRELLSDVALPLSIYKDILIFSSIHASVELSLPPGWTKNDDSLLYPLVIHILGIEDYDERDAITRMGWNEYLASGKFTAHVRIKLWRNDPLQSVSVRNMAKSLVEVIKVLLEDHKYLDRRRLSLWGWGSGASLALQISTLKEINFHCVLAINPIINWQQYNAFWVERYLGFPNSANTDNYNQESSILQNIKSFTSELMIIATTGDPISHHTFELAKSLIDHGIYFHQMVYSDSTMAIKKERQHVLLCMEHFFMRKNCIEDY